MHLCCQAAKLWFSQVGCDFRATGSCCHWVSLTIFVPVLWPQHPVSVNLTPETELYAVVQPLCAALQHSPSTLGICAAALIQLMDRREDLLAAVIGHEVSPRTFCVHIRLHAVGSLHVV